MIGRRPSQKSIEAARLALNYAVNKSGDGERAAKLWNDLRWKIKTIDGDYAAIQTLLAEFIVRAKLEIVSREVRDLVVQRLEEMRNRLSEFTVDQPDWPTTCARCGTEIEAGEYRKVFIHGQIHAALCAICSAL